MPEAEECDVKYEKVGCFKDVTEARTMSVLIVNDRTSSIDWGAWEKYLKRQVSRYNCATCDVDHTREMGVKDKYLKH